MFESVLSGLSGLEKIKLQEKMETIPTLFFIDKDFCEKVKLIANKNGFEYGYDLKTNWMKLSFNKNGKKIELLNEDFPHQGFYHLFMYNDIYVSNELEKFNKVVSDTQFFIDVIAAFNYKYRLLNTANSKISSDGYPHRKKAISAAYEYLWSGAIDKKFREEVQKDNEVQDLIHESWDAMYQEVVSDCFSKVLQVIEMVSSDDNK